MLVYRILLLLLCLAALPLSVHSCEPPAENHIRWAEKTEDLSQGVVLNATLLAEFNSTPSDAKPNQGKKTAEDALMEWLSSFLDFHITDVLIVIFTGVLAVKTSGLYRETAALREGADEQRADTNRAIRAAEASALAAQESAKAASIEVTGLQRPYIYISGVDEPKCYGNDHNPGLGYTIANYGKTPAKVIYLNIGFSVGHPEKIPGRADVDNPFVIDNVIRRDEKRSEYLPIDYKLFDDGYSFEFDRLTDNVPKIILKSVPKLYFQILITYEGPFSKGHETMATWEYVESQGGWRFIAVPDNKYAYEK